MNKHNPDLMVRHDAILLQEETPFQPQIGEVVEVPLLLSMQQISDLEEAAHYRGLTTGEMVRQLLQDFIGNPSSKALPISRRAPVF